MKEIWKEIKGYEGLYIISNNGEVVSLGLRNKVVNKQRIKFLKLSYDIGGYHVVTLCKNNHKKTYKTHRLVAIAFHDNPNNLPMINHKDECRTNNKANNLEWCTALYNATYNNNAVKRGLLERAPIIQYSKDMKIIKIWSGRVEIVEVLGFSGGNITSCCTGTRKTANNYIWKYLRE